MTVKRFQPVLWIEQVSWQQSKWNPENWSSSLHRVNPKVVLHFHILGQSLSRQGFHYTTIDSTYKWTSLWARHLTMRQVPFHFHVFQISILIFCLSAAPSLSLSSRSRPSSLLSTAVADSTDVQLPPQISSVLKVRQLQITSHAVFSSILLGYRKYTPCWVLHTVLYTCQNTGCQSGQIPFKVNIIFMYTFNHLTSWQGWKDVYRQDVKHFCLCTNCWCFMTRQFKNNSMVKVNRKCNRFEF